MLINKKNISINRGRNVYLIFELQSILKKFNACKIPVILLKGAVFLRTIYPDIGERYLEDIDVLIHKKNVSTAENLLFSLDYHFYKTNGATHNTYCKKGKLPLYFDLHWDIVNKKSIFQKYAFKLKVDDFWENALSINIDGVRALTMHPNDLIIYLSCHALKEYYWDKKWLEDIGKIIKYYKDQIDWKKVIDKAKKYKVTKSVFYALSSVKNNTSDVVSKYILNQLGFKKINWMDKKILNLIEKNKSIKKWRALLYFSVIEEQQDKIRIFLQLFPYSLKRISTTLFK